MTTGTFPQDPHRRRAVVVLGAYDIERCSYEADQGQLLLDEEAYVLAFPLEAGGEVHLALRNILDAGLCRPGTMLVQSPYDTDCYEDCENALERFAVAKHMYFSQLCMMLGARSVIIDQIDISTRESKTSLDLSAKRSGAFSGNVEIAEEELDRMRCQLSIQDDFLGGDADISAAEVLLRSHGLWSDPTLRSLLEARKGSGNRLSSRILKISLSSESKRNMSIAARLKIPSFVNMSLDYRTIVKQEKEFSLTLTVRF